MKAMTVFVLPHDEGFVKLVSRALAVDLDSHSAIGITFTESYDCLIQIKNTGRGDGVALELLNKGDGKLPVTPALRTPSGFLIPDGWPAVDWPEQLVIVAVMDLLTRRLPHRSQEVS